MSAPAAPAGGGVPGELATPGERLLAYLIDFGVMIGVGIVFGIIGAILGKILGSTGMIISSLLQLAVNLGYFIYFVGMDNPVTARGQTIGKKVMKIKIIKTDGGQMEVMDAVMRLVGYWVSSIVLCLGFIWILIDQNKQGWHDKIAKTYVIKAA